MNLFTTSLLYVFSALLKGRLDPDLVLFFAIPGKYGNTKKQKKKFFL